MIFKNECKEKRKENNNEEMFVENNVSVKVE